MPTGLGKPWRCEQYLYEAGGVFHPEKTLPLPNGSETALKIDDPPQHLLMEQILEPLACHLTHEHLTHTHSQTDHVSDSTPHTEHSLGT